MPRHEPDGVRPPARAAVPGQSKAAGILWIITGVLSAVIAGFAAHRLGQALREQGPDFVFVLVWFLWWLLLTLFGLMAGIRTVAGRSTEPIVNGVVSLLFALLFLGVAANLFVAGTNDGPRGEAAGRTIRDDFLGFACLFVVYDLLLLPAGVLALVGRNEYVRSRQPEPARRSEAGESVRRPLPAPPPPR